MRSLSPLERNAEAAPICPFVTLWERVRARRHSAHHRSRSARTAPSSPLSASIRNALLSACLACIPHAALAAEIRVLSAGAVEPGLRPALAAFEKASGDTVSLIFAAAPQIQPRLTAGPAFDLVIAPPAVLDELERAGKVSADVSQRVPIGRVGLGVAVRSSEPRPDISTPDAFKRALLDADSLVFNRASTGVYFEALLKRLGIDARVAAKTTRYADGAAVMAHVLQGQGREIGVGAITEILLVRERGLQLVGPLPAELQNFTDYVAAPTLGAPHADTAGALLRHLASPESKAGFAAAGVDPLR